MVLEPAALHLRFRDDAETSDSLAALAESGPPDVAAFLRGASTSADLPDEELGEELGVLPGTRTIDPSGPLVLFLQHPEFGIPAPGYDQSLPDLDCWSVRPTTFGWIATVSPPRPDDRRPGPRRAAQLLAGCLALTMPGSANAGAHALADAPASTPVQTPTTASKPPATASSTTVPTPPPAASPTPAPAETTPAASDWKPGPVSAPAPRSQDSKALADAAWEGIDGFVVNVELKGGKALRGRIGAVQADTFTLIDSSDGQILVIPKSGVTSVRAYVPPPVPDKNGGGLIAGGSVLTALGVPVFISGIVFVAICPSCVYLHVPMLVVGGAGLGAGIPMITKGLQRRTAFQKALEEHRITPMVSRTPGHGWTGGLQIRF